jgi:vanillate monooxygenase ferredoxin subunit
MSMPTIPLRVAKKTYEATDIVSLDLVPPMGSVLAPFTAGSHIEVSVPGGYTRHYSLCNHPAERDR